ncbi:MAG: PDZ domain-containing protein [Opitutaceae bacterium]
MKSNLVLFSTLIAAAALPLASLAQTPPAEKPVTKTEKKTLRIVTGSDDKGPKENVTFLGVETSPVDDTLSAQLGIADDTGLVVRTVVGDSPANGVLQAHDILLKLDDQVLIEVRQLAVLIRGKKAGDEVTLQLLRGGQPKTVKVKLVQREMPKRNINLRVPGPDFQWFQHSGDGHGAVGGRLNGNLGALHGMGQERLHELLGAMDEARGGSPRVHVFERQSSGGGDGRAMTIVNAANSNVVFTDDEGTLELTIKDGKKSLVAKSDKGDVLFDGPIDTPEQREKMSEAVRNRLVQIEKMEGFSFTTDGDFKGPRVRVIESPKRISMPMLNRIPALPPMRERSLVLPKAEPAI